MKKFVKKLGLNWDDLGFSDQEDEDSEIESEPEIVQNDENAENLNNSDSDGHKRIKYED